MIDYSKLARRVLTVIETPTAVKEQEPVTQAVSEMHIITDKNARSLLNVDDCTDDYVKETFRRFTELPVEAKDIIIDVAILSYNKTREWADKITMTFLENTASDVQDDKVLDSLLVNLEEDVRKAFLYLVHNTTKLRLPKTLEVSKNEDKVKFDIGVIIVPVECKNSHNYSLQQPIKCVESTIFYKFGEEMEKGNYMSVSRQSFRFPTFSEVVAFEWSVVDAMRCKASVL